jgi:exodeoxyribonuclease V alpha subunit
MAEVVLNKDMIFKCSVDAILHPNAAEEAKRPDKLTEAWTMFRTYIKVNNHYEPRICAGMALPLSIGDELTLFGDLVDTGSYGIQFKFSGIKKQMPTERNAVVSFLTKNVNGIGQVIAERIVDTIGLDVVNKIREDPNILVTVNGISEKKARNVKEQLDAMESSLEELQFFAKTGLGASRVAAVKMTYAELSKDRKKPVDVIKLIKENPYKLIEDVKGIGFKVADAVALNIGFPKDDPNRIAAGLEYTLKEEVDAKGNIWTTKESLLKSTASKDCLNLSIVTILTVLDEMLAKKSLIEENDRIYLPYYHELEFNIADKLKAIRDYPQMALSETFIEQGIKNAEKIKERILDDGQKDAVKNCINSNLSIVTGGPGVGKTTTLDILLYFLENECNMNITMAAPTGRAAKRMTEQTGRTASTIHSLSMKMTEADFMEGTRKQVLVVD